MSDADLRKFLARAEAWGSKSFFLSAALLAARCDVQSLAGSASRIAAAPDSTTRAKVCASGNKLDA